MNRCAMCSSECAKPGVDWRTLNSTNKQGNSNVMGILIVTEMVAGRDTHVFERDNHKDLRSMDGDLFLTNR